MGHSTHTNSHLSSSPNTQFTPKKIFVLGDGQLARMLRQAAEPLGLPVIAIGESCALAVESLTTELENSVITAEIERWPDTAHTQVLSQSDHFVNKTVFARLADRFTQKQLLDELNLATAPWCLLPEVSSWPNLFSQIGEKLVIKTRTGGYDGRGQWRIQADNDSLKQLPESLAELAIAEKMIPFIGEVSLVGARNHSGKSVFYPLTHNFHQDGILRNSVAFPADFTFNQSESGAYLQKTATLQKQAESMLAKIMDALNYVGVMAMECFVVESQDGSFSLLINELAPRVHNSGHWTQNGASISQFELHIRAVCNLPLPQPTVESPSVMINLIGTPLNYAWLSHPRAHLHWYDKEPRAGRKLGHINLNATHTIDLANALNELSDDLEDEYQAGINWAKGLLV